VSRRGPRWKRITAFRALTLLGECERQESSGVVRCVVDEMIRVLDAHVRAALSSARRR
jgi:hypothetical protein